MAVTRGLRTLVYRWSTGSDPFTREQMDASHAQIESLMAIDGQGTMLARPAAGVRGRYYFVVDPGNANDGTLFRDTGTAWRPIGGVSRTISVPHTFHVQGDVLVASGDNFVIPPMYVPAPAGQKSEPYGLAVNLGSGGSVTFRLRRLTTVSGGGTVASTIGGPYTIAGGAAAAHDLPLPIVALKDLDVLQLVIDAVSGSPRNLAVTVFMDYTA